MNTRNRSGSAAHDRDQKARQRMRNERSRHEQARALAPLSALASVVALSAIAMVATPASAEDRGKSIYDSTCVACHGSDGKGAIPGVPSLRKKDGPLAKSDDELTRNVLNGFQSPGAPLAMPPKGGNPALTEADVRTVLQYLRATFAK